MLMIVILSLVRQVKVKLIIASSSLSPFSLSMQEIHQKSVGSQSLRRLNQPRMQMLQAANYSDRASCPLHKVKQDLPLLVKAGSNMDLKPTKQSTVSNLKYLTSMTPYVDHLPHLHSCRLNSTVRHSSTSRCSSKEL